MRVNMRHGDRRRLRPTFTSTSGTASSPITVWSMIATTAQAQAMMITGIEPSPKIAMNSG